MVQKIRRKILLCGGALLLSPLAAIAQRGSYARRIGVLSGGSSSDPEIQACIWALELGLRDLGWRNLQVHARFAERDPARLRPAARELVGLQPEVLVAATSDEVAVLRDQTLSIPIVFTQVPDPVEAGLVTSFGRPSHNVTGLAAFDPLVCEGSLQAIKACAPGVGRVAVVMDPADPSWPAYVRAIEASAPALGMTWSPVSVQSPAELVRSLGLFAGSRNGTVFVLPSLAARESGALMIDLAARHRLPAIYPGADFTASGGLMSFGVNVPYLYRHAAAYIDRILKGVRTADLPASPPAKLDFAINLRTADELGLTVPETLLARADRVYGRRGIITFE